ncbi:hypothetical protein ABXV18_27080 [Vibrio owensii]|uniref:hypothetical protein n=1 Tax=Vibrio owensii TaxID=696485 RepID=UPI00339AB05F
MANNVLYSGNGLTVLAKFSKRGDPFLVMLGPITFDFNPEHWDVIEDDEDDKTPYRLIKPKLTVRLTKAQFLAIDQVTNHHYSESTK